MEPPVMLEISKCRSGYLARPTIKIGPGIYHLSGKSYGYSCRYSGSWIILLTAPSHAFATQWLHAVFVLTYSGGSAPDFHRVPCQGKYIVIAPVILTFRKPFILFRLLVSI
jgi:hypothetical protein